eukprot:9815822-Alexandrium_andersonii.AAC.1
MLEVAHSPEVSRPPEHPALGSGPVPALLLPSCRAALAEIETAPSDQAGRLVATPPALLEDPPPAPP